MVQPCNVGGQFPDASNVFPARSPRAVLRVNADRLAKLTRFAGGFTDGGSVFLKVYDNGLPLVMEAENGGQHLVALLQTIHMPDEKPAE